MDTIYLQSNSASSKKTYRTAIVGIKNGFRIFLQEKYNCDEVQLAYRVENEELDIYKVLSEHVIFLDKKDIKAKTIRLWLTIVKGYFSFMGTKVFAEKCRQRVKLLKKVALTKEILIKLRNLSPKLQAAVLVGLSAGLKIGEITGLTLPDIEEDQKFSDAITFHLLNSDTSFFHNMLTFCFLVNITNTLQKNSCYLTFS